MNDTRTNLCEQRRTPKMKKNKCHNPPSKTCGYCTSGISAGGSHYGVSKPDSKLMKKTTIELTEEAVKKLNLTGVVYKTQTILTIKIGKYTFSIERKL